MKLSTDILFSKVREAMEKRHEPEGVRFLGNLYWRTLLASAFVILIAVFLYATLELLNILSELSAPPESNSPTASPLDRATLDSLVQGFQARQSQFQNLESNPPPAVPDPSQ